MKEDYKKTNNKINNRVGNETRSEIDVDNLKTMNDVENEKTTSENINENTDKSIDKNTEINKNFVNKNNNLDDFEKLKETKTKTEVFEDVGSEKKFIDDLDKCVFCNLCSSSCPVFYATSKQTMTPLAKISFYQTLKKEVDGVLDDFLLDKFVCVDCGFCKMSCPLNIGFNYKLFKEETKDSNEEDFFIHNLRKYQNPFGPKS